MAMNLIFWLSVVLFLDWVEDFLESDYRIEAPWLMLLGISIGKIACIGAALAPWFMGGS